MEQLLLTIETKEEHLERELANLKIQQDKVRKSQFAKIGALTKTVNDLLQRMEIYDAYICKGRMPDQFVWGYGLTNDSSLSISSGHG